MGRRRRSPGVRRIGRLRARCVATIIAALLMVSACTTEGGSTSAGTPSRPPSSPPSAVATPASTMASATPAASTPSTPGGSTSPFADVTLASKLYPYVLTLPGHAVAIAPRLATVAWDGSTRIDSGDAQTDWLGLEGDRTLFIYGSRSDASLADFSASSQKQVAEWHGCPDRPESTSDFSLGGSPARLHAFHCQGLLVMKVMAIRDGFGLVVNQIGPDRDLVAEEALLTSLIASLRWTST